MSTLKFADSVWHRVVQIIQESMLEGVDCADLLRQVRVTSDDSDPHVLVLTPEYQIQVRDMHDKLLKEAHARQAVNVDVRYIVDAEIEDAN
jgi:hypothetical protein